MAIPVPIMQAAEAKAKNNNGHLMDFKRKTSLSEVIECKKSVKNKVYTL